MLALLDQKNEPIVANETEAVIARDAAERLRRVAVAGDDLAVNDLIAYQRRSEAARRTAIERLADELRRLQLD